MKVTVTKYLNVRVGEPSVNAPCFQYLAPGSVIDVDDDEHKGDVYDDIDTWYKDEANNYYWTGGAQKVVIPKSQPLETAAPAQLDWYHEEYKLPELWQTYDTQGEGIRVAIMDSGIIEHPCLPKNITGHNYVNNTSTFIDNHGHGSRVAGMICASGPGLIGVAPKAEIFIAKVVDTGNPTAQAIADALDKLPGDIRIVVIPHAMLDIDFVVPGMTLDALKKVFSNSKRILFCSAGDNDPGSGTFNKFPASITSPNILSLAAVKKDKVIKASCKSDHITLAAPGADVKVVIKPTPNNEQGITIDSGTSFSAPFAAGIMALMLSRRKKLVSRSPMKLRLKHSSVVLNRQATGYCMEREFSTRRNHS